MKAHPVSQHDLKITDNWAREAILAQFATSHGAEILQLMCFPWSGQVQAAAEAIEPLQRDLSDWQFGPFSDWDLELGEAYELPVADGNIWLAWQSVLDHQRMTTLWCVFGPHFSAQELGILVNWKRTQTDVAQLADSQDPELAALLIDPMMAAVLTDVKQAAPPCHPKDILVSNA